MLCSQSKPVPAQVEMSQRRALPLRTPLRSRRTTLHLVFSQTKMIMSQRRQLLDLGGESPASSAPSMLACSLPTRSQPSAGNGETCWGAGRVQGAGSSRLALAHLDLEENDSWPQAACSLAGARARNSQQGISRPSTKLTRQWHSIIPHIDDSVYSQLAASYPCEGDLRLARSIAVYHAAELLRPAHPKTNHDGVALCNHVLPRLHVVNSKQCVGSAAAMQDICFCRSNARHFQHTRIAPFLVSERASHDHTPLLLSS